MNLSIYTFTQKRASVLVTHSIAHRWHGDISMLRAELELSAKKNSRWLENIRSRKLL